MYNYNYNYDYHYDNDDDHDYDCDYIYLSHYESSNPPGDMAVESLHPPRVLTNLVLIL